MVKMLDVTFPVAPELVASVAPPRTTGNWTEAAWNGSAAGEEEEGEAEVWRHSAAVAAALCAAYAAVFAVGLLGNGFVVAVVARSPRMRTVTNHFIVNLALADILVLLVCLPATLLANILVPWMLGWFMCKTVSYLQGVSVSASINTLVAISIDRFLAICYPLRCQMGVAGARRVIAAIWAWSLAVALPWALYFRLEEGFCVEVWPDDVSETRYFLAANLGLCYLLPLALISLCYLAIWIKVCRRSIPGETKGTNADVVMQRSKLKVVKMMVVVVALFAVSWLPLYAVFAVVKLGGPIEEESAKARLLAVLAPVAQWLGASNSCINPVLYAFLNAKFRRGFAAIVRSRRCCGTLRYQATGGTAKSTAVLRSTFRSRFETQCEDVSTAHV